MLWYSRVNVYCRDDSARVLLLYTTLAHVGVSAHVRVNNQCQYEPLCALLEFTSRRTSAGICNRR